MGDLFRFQNLSRSVDVVSQGTSSSIIRHTDGILVLVLFGVLAEEFSRMEGEAQVEEVVEDAASDLC